MPLRRFYLCLVSILLSSSLFSTPVFARDGDSRLLHRFGAYIGAFDDPFPTFLGFNFAYNTSSWSRITCGVGFVTQTDTVGSASATITGLNFGGGIKFFVPNWSLSPTIGMNYAQVNVSYRGDPSKLSVDGFTQSGSHGYVSLGLELQTSGGFMIGAGVNVSLLSIVENIPYANIGMFF
jgi:hypothetical protein